MAPTTGLSYRQPELRWMLIATLAGVSLHGFCWLTSRLLLGDPNAVAETLRQMLLAVAWMICGLILWKLKFPPTRLHATLGVLLCALIMILLGSGAALFKLTLLQGYPLAQLLKTFFQLSVMLLRMQLTLAIPAAILLQALALRRVHVS